MQKPSKSFGSLLTVRHLNRYVTDLCNIPGLQGFLGEEIAMTLKIRLQK